jgi:hypothetical protein
MRPYAHARPARGPCCDCARGMSSAQPAACLETVAWRPSREWDPSGARARADTRLEHTVTMSRLRTEACALALLALCLVPARALGAPPARGWDPAAARGYPILRVYACTSELGAQLGVDTDFAQAEVVNATNEWFTGGGADIRLAYFGTLPAGHPACTDFGRRRAGDPGPVPPGWIVVTAQPSMQRCGSFLGPCVCVPSDTQIWTRRPPLTLGPAQIYAARVVLARGDGCMGPSATLYPWTTSPAAVYPAYDLGTTFVHEFGHALGFVDDDTVPSVMTSAPPVWTALRRHLFRDDVAGLRGTYGPLRSRPEHTTAALGSPVFLPPLYQTEPLTVASLGQAACAHRFSFLPGSSATLLLVANTEVDTGSTGTVSTYVTGGDVASASVYARHTPSNLPPAVACGGGTSLLAIVDPDGRLAVRRSTDLMTWSGATLPTLPPTGVTPSLAFASWNGAFVMVVSDRDTDLRHLLVSRDGGVTFAEEATSPGGSFVPVGFACVPSAQQCLMVDRGCSRCGSTRSAYQFDATTGRFLWAGTGYLLTFDPGTFGLQLAVAGENRILMLTVRNQRRVDYVRWLDSAEETAGSSLLGLGSGSLPFYTPDPTRDWHRPASDSLGAATFDSVANQWVVFYTLDARYSTETFITVP